MQVTCIPQFPRRKEPADGVLTIARITGDTEELLEGPPPSKAMEEVGRDHGMVDAAAGADEASSSSLGSRRPDPSRPRRTPATRRSSGTG